VPWLRPAAIRWSMRRVSSWRAQRFARRCDERFMVNPLTVLGFFEPPSRVEHQERCPQKVNEWLTALSAIRAHTARHPSDPGPAVSASGQRSRSVPSRFEPRPPSRTERGRFFGEVLCCAEPRSGVPALLRVANRHSRNPRRASDADGPRGTHEARASRCRSPGAILGRRTGRHRRSDDVCASPDVRPAAWARLCQITGRAASGLSHLIGLEDAVLPQPVAVLAANVCDPRGGSLHGGLHVPFVRTGGLGRWRLEPGEGWRFGSGTSGKGSYGYSVRVE
jgi:hypothetical protein